MVDIALPDGSTIKGIDARRAAWSWWNVNKDGEFAVPGLDLSTVETAVDAGANIGVFSRWLLSRAPKARVWCAEPVPDIADCLEANLEGYGGRATCSRVAFGERDGDATIHYYPRANDESSMLGVDRARELKATVANWEARMKAFAPGWKRLPRLLRPLGARFLLSNRYRHRRVRAKTLRLSDFMRRSGIERVDFLKVDASGAEWSILAGIDEGDWRKIRAIALAIRETADGGAHERARILLEGKGFTVLPDDDGEIDAVGRGVVKAIRR